MGQRSITISVANRKLSIACPNGQESALIASANELDKRLISTQVSINTNTKSPEQTLLMTALNLAHDLLAQQKQHANEKAELLSKIDLLQSTINSAMQSTTLNTKEPNQVTLFTENNPQAKVKNTTLPSQTSTKAKTQSKAKQAG